MELPQHKSISINILSVTDTDGPTINTRSQTCAHLSTHIFTLPPDVSDAKDPTPKSLTVDRLQVLLQMQKTDPFCKRISKRLSYGKAPQHETDLFIHVRGLLYKHVNDSGQKFLDLVLHKSWKYTVLVEAHDKLGHQGNTIPTVL